MKKVSGILYISISICLLILSSFTCLPNAPKPFAPINGEEEKICLDGCVDNKDSPRRYTQSVSTADELVTATKVGNDLIRLNFVSDLGNLVISVYDQMGNTVYTGNVEAVAGQQSFITISGYADGTYTLVIARNMLESLQGQFDIISSELDNL